MKVRPGVAPLPSRGAYEMLVPVDRGTPPAFVALLALLLILSILTALYLALVGDEIPSTLGWIISTLTAALTGIYAMPPKVTGNGPNPGAANKES